MEVVDDALSLAGSQLGYNTLMSDQKESCSDGIRLRKGCIFKCSHRVRKIAVLCCAIRGLRLSTPFLQPDICGDYCKSSYCPHEESSPSFPEEGAKICLRQPDSEAKLAVIDGDFQLVCLSPETLLVDNQ